MSMENNGFNFDATNAAILNGTYGLLQSTWNMKNTKELAQYQNRLNIENWNMMNAYNSPAAQMQRFKDAGLNPNLIYGQGTPGNASSAPAADHVGSGFRLPDIQLGSMLMELKHQQLENKALAAQTERTKIGNQQAALDFKRKQYSLDAWQLFAADKLGNDISLSFVPDGYDMSEYKNLLRNSSDYQQFHQLWQKGLINEKTLSNFGVRNNLLGQQLERYNNIDQLFNGEINGVGDFFKKLLYIITIFNSNNSNF